MVWLSLRLSGLDFEQCNKQTNKQKINKNVCVINYHLLCYECFTAELPQKSQKHEKRKKDSFSF